MKCRKIQKRLSAYQDGELRSVEQDRIKIHLMDCTECRKQYNELQRIWQVLGELPDIQPALGFHLQVRGKISGLKEANFIPRLRHVFKLLPSPLAMATLLLVGLVMGTYLGRLLFEEGFSSFQRIQPSYAQEHVSLASIRSFDAVPPGTLAHGYLTVTSHEQEAQR
jgi:anti-sigma factor RsiW